MDFPYFNAVLRVVTSLSQMVSSRFAAPVKRLSSQEEFSYVSPSLH